VVFVAAAALSAMAAFASLLRGGRLAPTDPTPPHATEVPAYGTKTPS